jgi:hypothetical protein
VLTVFTLPFPLLHKLQLGRRQIWGLVVTFGLGIITVSVSVVRFATIEVIQAWTNVCEWTCNVCTATSIDACADVLSMAEMSVSIMVVALPSMRSFLRRGSLFSSRKTYSSSNSRTGYGAQTPIVTFGTSGKRKTRLDDLLDDSGSEVELNTMSRKDVIYETKQVSVQFSNSRDESEIRKGKNS